MSLEFSCFGVRLRRNCWSLLSLLLWMDCCQVWGQQRELQPEYLQDFQQQELCTAKFGNWIFPIGQTPRLVWRDGAEVQRRGTGVDFQIRWFDSELREFPSPVHSGRWLASIQGTAPNGSPFKRSFTFFAIPNNLDGKMIPTIELLISQQFQSNEWPVWSENQREIQRFANDLFLRGLADNEQGAILVAGIFEAKERGRAATYVESGSVQNDQLHLDLKVKLQGGRKNNGEIQRPRSRSPESKVLRDDDSEVVGVPASAKVSIDHYCREWAKATHEPFVTLIAKEGVIITHEAFSPPHGSTPVDRDYRCWIASLTKTLTAIMLLQFVDQKIVELDRPLSDVFPDFPKNSPHVPTFRQCLNHTSGLSGHSDFGAMKNPHLENVVLNGLEAVNPGKKYEYCGLGFELVAKAMEVLTGQCAARLYDEYLFRPLGFGDVLLGNASSDAELTAHELAVVGQWIANRGCYGNQEFISATTFEEMLPKATGVENSPEQGLGLNWVIHRAQGGAAGSTAPPELLFSKNTVGHGSFSGCILLVDLEQGIVIAQVRRRFSESDQAWYDIFFQAVANALAGKEPPQFPVKNE